eukprot:CAMPEP_0177369816 /NCGR_PEP_ID=MMETSP0368-20130122/41652_1 /TAXON_ID=447022 ORGANISM="Scrippsiella hangoei-like, Strain SHHI-4" /NCGR_SAMPLE_ID=MMETSP0368 /ASSEMBLY_ACC=CAM_ASM_000363 /LENGTH=157 /DNA_ID=CAMNT_0018833023 /DNA_START=278 /DNA_END=749 /DNA_ORIENTATION=-
MPCPTACAAPPPLVPPLAPPLAVLPRSLRSPSAQTREAARGGPAVGVPDTVPRGEGARRRQAGTAVGPTGRPPSHDARSGAKLRNLHCGRGPSEGGLGRRAPYMLPRELPQPQDLVATSETLPAPSAAWACTETAALQAAAKVCDVIGIALGPDDSD